MKNVVLRVESARAAVKNGLARMLNQTRPRQSMLQVKSLADTCNPAFAAVLKALIYAQKITNYGLPVRLTASTVRASSASKQADAALLGVSRSSRQPTRASLPCETPDFRQAHAAALRRPPLRWLRSAQERASPPPPPTTTARGRAKALSSVGVSGGGPSAGWGYGESWRWR